jgi:hypothetical protein
MAKQENRPPLTESEQKCYEALKRLKKKYGDKRPPIVAIAKESGYSFPRANQLMLMVEAKGYAKNTWEVFA